jgi:ribose transport system substrate-binding protein
MMNKKPLATFAALGLAVAVLAPSTSSFAAAKKAATKATPPAVIAAAKAATIANKKGTFRAPPTTGPALKKNIRVMYISCLEVLPSCSEPTVFAKEVAADLGWKMDIRDAQGVQANNIPFVEEAVAGKYDVIIAQSMDCGPSKAAIQKAVAAKIPVVTFYSFDCNDPKSNAGPPLFTSPNYSPNYKGYAEFTLDWGKAKADWLIQKSNGKAKVIELRQEDAIVVAYINDGFEAEMKKCTGCQIVDTVKFTGADIASGAFAQKVATALTVNPTADSIHIPYDGLLLMGGLGALKDANKIGKINVVGGETVSASFDMLRSGAQTMANVFVHAWTVRAAFDTANRALNGETKFPDSGLGWIILDKDNAPKVGAYDPPFDYRAAYKKIWGLA